MNQEEMSNENLMSLLQTSNFGEQGNVSALQVLQIQEERREFWFPWKMSRPLYVSSLSLP